MAGGYAMLLVAQLHVCRSHIIYVDLKNVACYTVYWHRLSYVLFYASIKQMGL